MLSTVDGGPLSVALDVADELAVVTTENAALILDASHARRLADELIACADAIDALHQDVEDAF